MKKKKKKKKVLTSFYTFSCFHFPIFHLFLSIFTPFLFFPCLFFPDTSAKIPRSEVSGGHSAPPPPPPRLLRHCILMFLLLMKFQPVFCTRHSHRKGLVIQKKKKNQNCNRCLVGLLAIIYQQVILYGIVLAKFDITCLYKLIRLPWGCFSQHAIRRSDSTENAHCIITASWVRLWVFDNISNLGSFIE